MNTVDSIMALTDNYAQVTRWSNDGSSDEARAALLTALQEFAAEKVGETAGKVVPLEPTEEMWAYLARDIVFWLYTCQAPHYGSKLHEFLNNCGTTIPEWLTKEIPNTESTPAKGTVAVCIYKAMIAEAPQPAQPVDRLANAVLDLMTPEGSDVSDIGAQPVAQPLSLTDEMVVAAARVLCKQHTDTCGVDQHDAWNFYADDFKSDAREVLQAVIGIGAKK